MKKPLNTTKMETDVLKVIAANMNGYSDGFCDVDMDELVESTGYSVRTLKGVVGSLLKKELIELMDVNGEYNIYYLAGEAKEELLTFKE